MTFGFIDRELAANWDIDIAEELECLNAIIKNQEEHPNCNFAEAAIMIQVFSCLRIL